MKTKVFLIIIIVLIIIYFIPVQSKNFFDLYHKKDSAAQSLSEFYKRPTKTLMINGNEWKYYVGGKGNKTILFIHGMGGAYDLWWQQIKEFENDFKVISYTLPENVDNLNDALEGIKAILKKENVDKFYAVGTSMGGYITQYLVKNMPDRVEKAVFGNTFPPNDEIRKENKVKARIIPYLPEMLIGYFGNKSLQNKILPAAENDSLLAAFLPTLPFSKKQFINRYRVVIDFFTINPSVYQIKRIPKLIMESDNDPLISPNLRKELKALYPDAQVYTFHKAGHFPYINRADEYNRVLRKFLESPNPYQQVEKTLNSYFEARKKGDLNLMKKAFYEPSLLFTTENDTIKTIDINQYFQMIDGNKNPNLKTRILYVSIQNNLAFAKTLFEYHENSYLDFLNLIKAQNNWKIVNKNFTKLKSQND